MQDTPATLPDYQGGGIVNLMSSVARALGGATPYPALALLPPEELATARNVVLLVIDCLGHGFLQRRDGVLRRHLCGRLTSVFPSTTASAIPTFMTGLPPRRHGITGWHMYFREIGAVAASLPYRTRTGRQALEQAGVRPAELLKPSPLFDRLPLPCHVLAPRHIVHTEFNTAYAGRAQRHGYEGLEEMFALMAELLKQPGARRYVYAYWPELDSQAHEHGISSPQADRAYAALDTAFGHFLSRVAGSDSAILVTADHGFIDTAAEDTIDLDRHPILRETLLLPLCGEPRMAYAYVRSGQARRFEAYVREHLAGQVLCMRSEEVVRQGWLGPGEEHPALATRLGDYVLIPQGRSILRDWLPGEERHTHIGVHGGLSEAEMHVPLILLKTSVDHPAAFGKVEGP